MAKAEPKTRILLPKRYKKGDVIEVRIKVKYPSTTGLKFVEGKFVPAEKPADYLDDVKVYYGDTLISHFDLTAATSPNPLFRIKVLVDKEAPLKVVVTLNEIKDDKGNVVRKAKDYVTTVQIKPQ